MTALESLILGTVQGVTEFLPISSSGHLVIFQHLMGFDSPQLMFDVVLHFATLVAVVVFFFKDIIKLKKRYLFLLLVATLPAGLVGLLLNESIELLFSSIKLVSLLLIVTGVFNFLIDKLVTSNRPVIDVKKMSFKKSFGIGLLQALAILPGISRSGSTIFAGAWMGLKRLDAFKFSFLLSIPAIMGATLLQLIKVVKIHQLEIFNAQILFGFLSAFITGLLSLKLLKVMMEKAEFKIFGIYCVVLGVVGLIFF
jgi:undecaprenyl-diphosphatase